MKQILGNNSSKITHKFNEFFYRLAIFYLILLFSLMIIPGVLLLFIKSLSIITSLLSVLIAVFLYVFLFGLNKKSIISLIIGTLLGILLLMIIGFIPDISYDGLAIHKVSIGFLSDGWNPIRETAEDWILSTKSELSSLQYGDKWIEHYSRGVWIFSSSIYMMTGNIECGKIYTLLLMIILIAVLSNFMIKKGFKPWQSYFVGIIAALNPVSLSQVLTFYNDAALMLSLFISIVFLTDIYYNIMQKDKYILLLFSLTIGIGTKFTGLMYCGLFCVVYLFIIVLVNRHKPDFKIFMKRTGIVVACIIVTTLVLTPYISNYLDHGNPLYPLQGEDHADIMTGNTPDVFKDQSDIKKDIGAIYYSIDSDNHDNLKFRYPLSFTKEEIKSQLSYPDLRINGYGVFFNVTFTASVIIVMYALITTYKKNNKLFILILSNSLLTFILHWFLSESWWARYAVYLYGCVIIALIILFNTINKHYKIGTKVFFAFFITIVVVNSMLFLPILRADSSMKFAEEMRNIGVESEHNNLRVYFGTENDSFSGLYYNFRDMDISFTILKYIDENMQVNSQNKFLYKYVGD